MNHESKSVTSKHDPIALTLFKRFVFSGWPKRYGSKYDKRLVFYISFRLFAPQCSKHWSLEIFSINDQKQGIQTKS